MKISVDLDKPLICTAFALARDPAMSTYQRDGFFSAFLEAAWQHLKKKNHGALVGALLWAWGGEGRPSNEPTLWQMGAQWTGDPPGEQQGRLSVLDSDGTTVELLQARATSVP